MKIIIQFQVTPASPAVRANPLAALIARARRIALAAKKVNHLKKDQDQDQEIKND